MTANTAKIRPKTGQHPANHSNYAVVSGLPTLYPPFSTLLPTSRPVRATDRDRQADWVRGARPGAGVGHARQHICGSPCVCRLFAECPLVFYGIDWTHEMMLGEVKRENERAASDALDELLTETITEVSNER